MRIVTIELAKPRTFWNFQNIKLTPKEPASEPLDLDLLSSGIVENIMRSVNYGVIEIVEAEGTEAALELENPEGLSLYEAVLPKQEHEHIEIIRDIQTVTVADIDEEEEEIIEPEEKDYKNAEVFLNKNGNTVVKALRAMGFSPNSQPFLMACIEMESNGKSRKSVVTALDQAYLAITMED